MGTGTRTTTVPASAEPCAGGQGIVRSSLALEPLAGVLAEVQHPAVLDLGCVWQSTVAHFTHAGCKLYTEDVFALLDQALHHSPPTAPPLPQRIFPYSFQYPPESFRGVLAWDLFDYLPEELVESLAARVVGLLEPGGGLVIVARDRLEGAAFHRYRVRDARTLELVAAPLSLRPARALPNRAVLNLFSACHASRTFLGRDHLREFFFVK
jgi:hypothetical protein